MGGFFIAVLLPILYGKVLDLFPGHSINEGYHYGFVIAVLFSVFGLVGSMLINEEEKETETGAE